MLNRLNTDIFAGNIYGWKTVSLVKWVAFATEWDYLSLFNIGESLQIHFSFCKIISKMLLLTKFRQHDQLKLLVHSNEMAIDMLLFLFGMTSGFSQFIK